MGYDKGWLKGWARGRLGYDEGWRGGGLLRDGWIACGWGGHLTKYIPRISQINGKKLATTFDCKTRTVSTT